MGIHPASDPYESPDDTGGETGMDENEAAEDLTVEIMAVDELTRGAPPAERWILSEVVKMQKHAGILDIHRRKAMAGIAERFHQRLTRYCRGKLGPHQDEAEDVVQDVLQDVERLLARVKDEKHLRNLLFRLAKNKCADIVAKHRRVTLSNEIRYAPLMLHQSEEEDGDERARDAKQLLRRAIRKLPKLEDRILLKLSLDYRMPVKHIATLLEISEGACKMRRHRARQKLKEILEAER